jgi:nitrogen fixation/metabolism regulation signal transduction histidine kinase
VYWSDFHYVPDYQIISSNSKYKFVEDQDIQFIAQHRQIEGTDLSVCMLLPLHISRDHPNNYIQESYNRDVFSSEGDKVQITSDNTGIPITSEEGDHLFSVNLAEQIQIKSTPVSYMILILASLAMVCLLIYLFSLVRHLFKREKFNLGFLVLVLGLLLIRLGMLLFDFPGAILDFHVFDPQLYASSDINRSLGDLFFNELTLLVVVVFVFKNYLRLPWYQRLTNSTGWIKSLTAITWMLVSILLLYLQYYVITLFYHSQWSLDIAAVLDFTFVKFLSLIIIVINAVVYFLVTHMAMVQSQKLLGRSLNQLILHYALAVLVFVTFSVVFNWSWPVILTLSTLYLGVLHGLGITAYLGKFNYVSFLYLFLGALFCAVTGAYAINSYEKMENITKKHQLADQLLNERDFLGEFLLSEAVANIKDDPYILNQLVFNPYTSTQALIRKVERFYLSQHLDRYQTSVHLFDAKGDPVNVSSTFLRYQDFESQYALSQNSTEYQGLYFVNEITADQLSRYLYLIPLELDQFRIGHIVLDLKLKRVIPNTVYPELLVHNKSMIKDNGFSYAIFSGGKLINTSGNFNYAKNFDPQILESELVYNRGINLEGSHHLAVDGPNERIAVISSVTYPIRNVLGNFSFLFIIFIFCLILFILFYVFVYRTGAVKLNYATRIQLYLNLAFFLPLIIVSVTTLSLISSYSKKEVIEKYFEKAEGVRNNIVTTLEQYQEGYMEVPEMAQSLTQLSLYSELDINLFNDKGKLISTSQPKIYQYNLLSEFINPLAYHSIVEDQSNSVLLNESVGLLEYKSAYVGIRSFESGSLMGILSIPFFESKYELDKEIVVILINILNIFTFIFIVILVASYFASRALTVPLSLITQKIKKTTLTGYNEPLEWESDDEIGLMVGEYNRMLKNLEASKTALARSEKESAWREMAQQVAHEIKNPLTPMKLTLQHLKRTLTEGNAKKESISEKPLNSLLQQIDTLSDIATSFSSFAKMPVPKNQRFEAGSVLKKTIDLHGNNTNHNIISDLEAGAHFVMGDPQLMGRIFSNLIINGIQAVPEGKSPKIKVSLYTENNQLVIKFQDNGSGIPEALQDKIFIPNFSTKESGSGLGLPIAKRGIEHAGGKIWFKTGDQGTTIFIELPLVD